MALVVVILDGWGISFSEEGNAIAQAKTPNMDSYAQFYPSAAIAAAGVEVGLPWGEVGNSETGHRNIGAGQVAYQVLPKIDNAISEGSFFTNKTFIDAIEHVQKHDSNMHLMGLVSPGGVHSHMKHLFALLKLCQDNKLQNVYIHMFTDGRDAPPQASLDYLKELEKHIKKTGVGAIASICGRFYAMDRNKNWERTQETYELIVNGRAKHAAPTAQAAIEQAYADNLDDEHIPPTVITQGGAPVGTVSTNDALIFFNFRPDRARQLSAAFASPADVGFPAQKIRSFSFATMTQYDPSIPAPFAFEEEKEEHPLARVLSDAGLKQLHIAETEKYAHITYYLNVGNEKPYPKEDHVLIKSSSAVNFAKEPHMRAKEITTRVVSEIKKGSYDVYFVNFANPDMVGHTGDMKATVEACAFVDTCVGAIEQAVTAADGTMIVTADHGNAEEKIHPESGASEKEHTSNPVPLHYVAANLKRTTPKSEQEIMEILSEPIGVLADVAPTILDILGIKQPPSMTGVSLLRSLR